MYPQVFFGMIRTATIAQRQVLGVLVYGGLGAAPAPRNLASALFGHQLVVGRIVHTSCFRGKNDWVLADPLFCALCIGTYLSYVVRRHSLPSS